MRRWVRISAGAFVTTLVAVGVIAYTSLLSPPTTQANIFVNTTAGGSPARCSSVCSYDSSKAYGSLQAAWDAHTAGDLILVKGGTYNGQVLTKGSDAGAGPMTTFREVPGETAQINNIVLGDSGTGTHGAPSYVTFDGIDVNGIVYMYYDASDPGFITYKNAHVWNTSGAGSHLLNFHDTHDITIQNVECGPQMSDGDCLNFSIGTQGQPPPRNILVDRVYVHDLYDSCDNLPSALDSQYGCTGFGFGDINKTVATLGTNINSTDTTATVAWAAGVVPPVASVNPFTVKIGTEQIRVTNVVGNTITFSRNASQCGAAGGAASHSNGDPIVLCNGNGYDHVDGWQSTACNVCTIQYSRFYAGNPTSSTTTGSAQGIYMERINCNEFVTPGGVCYKDITIKGNMLQCFCGTNLFSMGSTPQVGGFQGFIKILYNTMIGRRYDISDVNGQNTTLSVGPVTLSGTPQNLTVASSSNFQNGTTLFGSGNPVGHCDGPSGGTTLANCTGTGTYSAGTIISQNKSMLDGPSRATTSIVIAGNVGTSDTCTYQTDEFQTLTPTIKNNIWDNATCDATDTLNSYTPVSADFFTPNLHQGGSFVTGAVDAYCGPGKDVDTDLDGDARPGGGCHVGADQ